jgi:hypothetical protein
VPARYALADVAFDGIGHGGHDLLSGSAFRMEDLGPDLMTTDPGWRRVQVLANPEDVGCRPRWTLNVEIV